MGKQMAPMGGGAESCGGTAGPIRDTTEADGPGSTIAKVHGSTAVYGRPARPSERISDSKTAAPRWTIPVHWPGSIKYPALWAERCNATGGRVQEFEIHGGAQHRHLNHRLSSKAP